MALLTTRVRIPDEDDWRKLQWVLQYIRSTIHMPLILRVEKLIIVKWWVNTSYTINQGSQSHTVATMYLVWGLVPSMFNRKKINSRILTEAELIGVDGVLP